MLDNEYFEFATKLIQEQAHRESIASIPEAIEGG